MDGYHLHSSVLERMTDSQGTPLKKLKGHSYTFDCCAFIRDLERLRSDDTIDSEVSIPVYDRKLHEPVKDARVVLPSHRIVLVEGLHLLCDKGEWTKAYALFDRRILLEIPLSACREAVIERKVKGGRHRDDCELHFNRVDRPIFEDLKTHRLRADIIIAFRGGEGHYLQLRAIRIPQSRLLSMERAGKKANSGILRKLTGHPPSEKQLLFVGVNPALQRLVKLRSDIKIGNVNRAEQILDGIGGKGQNAAVAASHLMSTLKKGVVCAPPCVAMFTGGAKGEALVDLLQKRGIDIISQPCIARTRVCYTIIGGKMPATELVGTWESEISNKEVEGFFQLLRDFCVNLNNLKGVGIMGSLPPGISEDSFYSDLLNILAPNLSRQKV
eukprot:232232_1